MSIFRKESGPSNIHVADYNTLTEVFRALRDKSLFLTGPIIEVEGKKVCYLSMGTGVTPFFVEDIQRFIHEEDIPMEIVSFVGDGEDPFHLLD